MAKSSSSTKTQTPPKTETISSSVESGPTLRTNPEAWSKSRQKIGSKRTPSAWEIARMNHLFEDDEE